MTFSGVLILALLFSGTRSVSANDETRFWSNPPEIDWPSNTLAQSEDWVIDVGPGTVRMNSIEFYMSVGVHWPSWVTITMAGMYGPAPVAYGSAMM